MSIQYIKLTLGNKDIKNKKEKVAYLEYLEGIVQKNTNNIVDNSDINLAYRTFEIISSKEKLKNKAVENFNREEIIWLLLQLDIVEMRMVYYVLLNYFSFLNKNTEVINSIDVTKISSEPKELLTFNEFKELIVNVLSDTSPLRQNRYYNAALLILFYYGIDSTDLPYFTYDDLNNSKLFEKIDDCFLEYLQKSCEINFLARYKSNKETRYLKLSGESNIICKPINNNSSVQLKDFYYRIVKRTLAGLEEYEALTVKRLNMSGAIHFFVKECIERGLQLNVDWLYSKNKNFAIYDEIAKKYGLNYRALKPISKKMSHVIKEYEEQLNI